MLNRVQIRAKCWPVQNCDIVLLQVVPSYPCCICARALSCWNVLFGYGWNVVQHGVSGLDHDSQQPLPHFLCLDQDFGRQQDQVLTAQRISFHHTVVIIALTLPSLNSCSSMGCLNEISAFIREDNILPLSISPVLLVYGPLETCLTVFCVRTGPLYDDDIWGC